MSTLREEIKHLKTEPRELRNFGLLVGGVFLLLGLWFVFRDKPWHAWFWVPGAGLIGFGLLAPRWLKRVYVFWMALGHVLGLFVSTVLLALFFYLVVTPIGLVARVIGKDFLSQRWSSAPSYWIIRPPSPLKEADYERQF